MYITFTLFTKPTYNLFTIFEVTLFITVPRCFIRSEYRLQPSEDLVTDRGSQTCLPLLLSNAAVQTTDPVQHEAQEVGPATVPSPHTVADEVIQNDIPQENAQTEQVTNIPQVNSGRFVCTFAHCNKSYTKKSDLKRHVESIHEGKKCTCATCQMEFTLKKNLAVHFKLHDNSTSHVCWVCGKGCQHEIGLASHLAGHSGEKNSSCPNQGCNKSYQSKSGIIKHHKVCGKSIEERQKYLCPQCPCKCTLKDHIANAHGEKGTFLCPECGYAMNNRGALKAHKCKV